MKFLEIISKLGNSASDESEKELLRDFYDRLREMIRHDCSEDEIEHRFCLMITGYLFRYVNNQVDYSETNADYYLSFLESRLISSEVSA
ncbi:hypothetical protein [Enterococcus pallens]|uniref:Uncharacterized protein n=1 Tax=Enterococcus pallens ATCC BAA-351 TaxID=1158607 RepID=R2RTS8_9ENTE|nr:hypothetical protein [Enterococcus pallens]EOH86730.1 hypothetical protein UAU_05176 [Enterococcus pallens ATCC BAA-351]EOU18526.1 hypothetical protein I588_03521 [Enterococcus pallens ATCC BAA-351]